MSFCAPALPRASGVSYPCNLHTFILIEALLDQVQIMILRQAEYGESSDVHT